MIKRIDQLPNGEWVIKSQDYSTATHVKGIEEKLETLKNVSNELLERQALLEQQND